MTLTLLLDLDDTLLDTNVDQFIPAYFQALSESLKEYINPELMLKDLMTSTRRMIDNQDPSRYLIDIFEEHFFSASRSNIDEIKAQIEVFYDTVFPTLHKVTNPRPEAVDFVKWAQHQRYRIAIATNPVFPLKAIRQRLLWAGLPVSEFHFSLVSSIESFHFAKPSLAYFTEVLGQLGCPEGSVMMIGDDLERDILPAKSLGLPVFWIRPSGEHEKDIACPQGGFDQLRGFLETIDISSLHADFSSPEALVAILRATPAVLDFHTRDLSEEKWRCQPQPEEWCLVEIMSHLRDVERDVNQRRIRLMLSEENPFIVGEETDRWVEERAYAKEDGRSALAQFMDARKETLALLSNLGNEWDRTARHAIFGPTTLKELVKFITEHDRAHINQSYKTAI